MSSTLYRLAIGPVLASVIGITILGPMTATATEQEGNSLNPTDLSTSTYNHDTAAPLREMYEQVLDTYTIVKYGNNYRIPSWRGTYDIRDQTYKMIWFHTGYSETSRTEVSRYYDASEDITTIVMRVNYSTY